MEARLHGADRPTETVADRVEGEIRPEAEDHDDPLVGRQPAESREQRVAVEERLERVTPRPDRAPAPAG
jgi:hypothetical protein